MRIAVVCPYVPSASETFIRAQVEELPAILEVVGWRPSVRGWPVLSLAERIRHKFGRIVRREDLQDEVTAAYRKAFRDYGITAVLAQYGPTGVAVIDACRHEKIPLTVHFHGFDASVKKIVDEYRAGYQRLFVEAMAIVAVSWPMVETLVRMGASPAKVYHNPCGVDCSEFVPTDSAANEPTLISVGRFIEKKAPDVTLMAFARALERVPRARLIMIGTGELLPKCVSLAAALGIDRAVEFLGGRPSWFVARSLGKARAFVQHSVTAPSGDMEGTPVSVLEAAAVGLPIVATRHGGIPEVVLHNRSGFLVEERDAEDMAHHMVRLLTDGDLARQMGRVGREHVLEQYQLGPRVLRLREIMCGAGARLAA